MGPDDALVFDTGPLRHFAVQGWLRVLEFVAEGRRVIIPESVEKELREQTHEIPALQQVLDAEWIHVDRSTDLEFLTEFSRYEAQLVVDRTNRGECGVLALGKCRGHEVVLDDQIARTIAKVDGVRVTATLPLLCRAIRAELLTVPMVEKVADDLLSGYYYLPFRPGEFRRWALEEGYLDYPG